ncbi:zinc phosphodiesterase ELAC protein 1-like isoform X3 [Acropora muricata]|uniref:zinc phosphodiesterase ELAC protein 1-like isoform X3 n=1 Tax=Acropora muricata TaxID=159855 RepID=UPI0034E3852D
MNQVAGCLIMAREVRFNVGRVALNQKTYEDFYHSSSWRSFVRTPWLIIKLNCAENRPPVEIFGPVGLRKYLRVCLELSQSLLGFTYSVHELHCSHSDFCQSGNTGPLDSSTTDRQHSNETLGRTIFENKDCLWQVCQESNLTVFAAPLKHRTLCFGYVVQEKQIPGKLDPSLLKQKGIPPGPLYSKIKNGESIIAPDGSQITPNEVMGPPRQGRKIVILGDTCDSSKIKTIAADADVVVHEATLADELKEACIDYGHSTPASNGVYAWLLTVCSKCLWDATNKWLGSLQRASEQRNWFLHILVKDIKVLVMLSQQLMWMRVKIFRVSVPA